MPWYGWVFVGWITLGALFGWGWSRFFRSLRNWEDKRIAQLHS